MPGLGSPDISVIIVSWNVREQLEQCLASVFAQQGVTFEVFVVDNASADGSAEVVRERFSNATVIANVQNVGFARANNQALTRAGGRHFLLLNPDTVVHPGALQKTVAYFDSHQDVGILGPKVLHVDGSVQRSVLRYPTFLSQLLVLLKVQAFTQKPRALHRYYALDFDYNREADVDQVMGAYFVFRRELYEQIGGLDGGFFLWFEEVDYCLRAAKAGWRIRYVPAITMTHEAGKSFAQLFSIEQQVIFNRSLLRYFRKHHSLFAYTGLLLASLPSLALAIGEIFVRRWYVPKPVR